MVSDLFFYELLLLGLLWLCVMLHYAWPSGCTMEYQRIPRPAALSRQPFRDPKPFPGLIYKPPCAACEQAHESAPQPPGCPPPLIIHTRGCPRQVDPNFCLPHASLRQPLPARTDPWQRLGQALAAANASYGRWPDGSRLDAV